MKEHIYTIPVNEAFDLYSGCPVCALYKKLEDNELDIILGPALMEPDIRIETNKKGFCGRHFDLMAGMKNRLGLALMLESHLALNINKRLKKGGGLFGQNKKLGKQPQTCYICDRIDYDLKLMIETVVVLWQREREFKEKLKKQPYFCIPHYTAMLGAGEYMLSKKLNADFTEDCRQVMTAYSEKLLADISWFIKKFDYNYQDEPWHDSKDAIERAIKFLCEYRTLRN